MGPLVATVQRLRAEFADVLDPPAILRAVQTCHRDLAGAPHGALPELVERLARQDLTDLVDCGERSGLSRTSDDHPGAQDLAQR